MTTPWTQLEGTSLWSCARAAHDAQAWRRYHGWSHPLHLYDLAGRVFGFDHDRSLDRAILAHDVVQGGPDPVGRSVSWLREMCPDDRAEALIASTHSHAPKAGQDNRMILLDLADFAWPELARRNTLLLEEEARLGLGWERPLFLRKTEDYLAGLADRVEAGAHGLDRFETEWFCMIAAGIRTTIREIRESRRATVDLRPSP